MKLYFKLKLYLLAFLSTHFVLAQDGIITGRLQDQQAQTIPFATVSVMKLPDSTLITGTTTNMEGEFELKPKFHGEVLLRFSAIGYAEVFTPPFEVRDAGFTRDFGVLTLKEEMALLNEVMISAWKPRVRAESGKMVMSVENSALAAGSTAYEVLTRAPGVSVGPEGNFSINGKQGVSVMLNGRLTYFSSADLKTLLESMPAENIKEIEVIHNPSAKYDAEGIAGMLNITLKENTLTGLHGSVYGGFRTSEQQLFNGGLNLQHNTGKWNSFLNLDLSEQGRYREPTLTREYPQGGAFSSFRQTGVQNKERLVPSGQLGTDYQISEGHSIGFMGSFSFQDVENTWVTQNVFRNTAQEEVLQVESLNISEEEFSNARFNFHYSGALDTIGTTISADIDYATLNRETDSRFTNDYFFPQTGSEDLRYLSNFSVADYQIMAGKADLKFPLSQSSALEVGVKASKVEMESELQFFDGLGDDRQYDPSASDRFDYKEEILAGYVIYSNKFNDTWNLQAGLRVEQTNAEGISYRENQTTPRDYLEFFPNLQLEQQVSENYKLSYAFNRRISRPDYQYVNPSTFFLDPYTSIVGNPGLRPQINNSVQFSQNLFKKYNLMLSYDFTDDFIAEMPNVNSATGETQIIIRNIKQAENYSATLSLPIEAASFWNWNNTLILNHQKYDMQIQGQDLSNENTFFMAQTNQQLNLPGDFKLELNGTYRTRSLYALAQIDGFWWIDAGIKKSFFNDKLDVTFRATDIFRGMNLYVTEDYFGNKMALSQYLDNQAFSINLRYNFGSGSTKEKARTADSLEEMNRAGG